MSLSNQESTRIDMQWENNRIVDIADNPLYREYTNYQKKLLNNKYRANKEKILESCFNTATESASNKICLLPARPIEICYSRINTQFIEK